MNSAIQIRYRLLSVMALLAALVLVQGQAAAGGSKGSDKDGRGCKGCEAYFDAVKGEPGTGDVPAPGDLSEPSELSETDDADAYPDTSLLASDFGATAGGQGPMPGMIGDFFGNGYTYAFTNPNGTTVMTAGGDRRFKYAENTSPFPTDRVFFNYHSFNDALLDIHGQSRDLSRFTFGLEKTFLNDLASIEVRIPFAGALDSDQEFTSATSAAAEFGNISLAAKALLIETECLALSAGLGLVLPTGDDAAVTEFGNPVITFENSSVYLQPFLGAYLAPNDRVFHQFVAQLDVDLNGSDVIVPQSSFLALNTNNGTEVSRLQGQTQLYLDYQVGYWAYRNPNARILTGVAPLLELHYTTTLQDLDLGSYRVDAGGFPREIFVEDFRRDVLNLTAGVFLSNHIASMKVAVALPLRDGTDKIFDCELGVQVVVHY